MGSDRPVVENPSNDIHWLKAFAILASLSLSFPVCKVGIVILPSQVVRREQIKICKVHVAVGTGQVLVPFPSWPYLPSVRYP